MVTDQFIGVAINEVAFYSQAGAVSTGAAAFCWVAAGLTGIVATAVLLDLMDQYVEWSGDLETSIYYYPDGTWSYGVDLGFVDRVRNFLFDTGVVVSAPPALDGISYPETFQYGINDMKANNKPYLLVIYLRNGGWHIIGSDYPIKTFDDEIQGPSYAKFANDVGGNTLLTYHPTSGSIWTSSVSYRKSDIIGTWPSIGQFSMPEPGVTSDYELGTVSPIEVPFPDAYPEWHTNSRPATKPDSDEEITVLPIPLNPSADPETQIGTLTQPNIWQGTIADPMPDMQPDPNPDPGTNPGTGAPSDIGKYQIDLTDFFPFCIPFDLYRFIEILCAEPEAPVFHWEFNVFGELHSLDVDLSPWNPHAQLFRDAQVGLFIMGLLWITRKFIKW